MNVPLPTSAPLYAVLVAGGSGSRMQSQLAKQYLLLAGKPMLMHSMEAFKEAAADVKLVVVLPRMDVSFWHELCREHSFTLPHQLVTGGATRFQSVKRGLADVPPTALVAIHDGVRPLIDPAIIRQTYAEAEKSGAAIAAVSLKDSIRLVKADGSSISLNRQDYQLAQTPQTFGAAVIQKAYLAQEQPYFTDCASVAEAAGINIRLVAGSYQNIKITTPDDLLFAEAILQSKQ